MDQLPIKAQRLSYPALICQDLESTLEFYRGVLGMEAIAWHPGPDDPSFTHLFMHAGGGAVLEFVGPSQPGRTVLAKGRLGVGSLQRLTLQLDPENFDQAAGMLRERGVSVTGPADRGHERMMWVRDPNGIMLELTAWLTALPDHANPVQVLRTAHRIREADGDRGLEDRHIQEAVAQLYGPAAALPL